MLVGKMKPHQIGGASSFGRGAYGFFGVVYESSFWNGCQVDS